MKEILKALIYFLEAIIASILSALAAILALACFCISVAAFWLSLGLTITIIFSPIGIALLRLSSVGLGISSAFFLLACILFCGGTSILSPRIERATREVEEPVLGIIDGIASLLRAIASVPIIGDSFARSVSMILDLMLSMISLAGVYLGPIIYLLQGIFGVRDPVSVAREFFTNIVRYASLSVFAKEVRAVV